MTDPLPTRHNTPQECIAAMEALRKIPGCGFVHLGDQTQQRCMACGRWKYLAERCTLFQAQGAKARK